MVHAEAMGELRRELVETLGRERARGVLTRMGYASGSRDAKFARRLYPNASDSEVYVVGPQLHNLEGIVNVRPVKFEMNVARDTQHGKLCMSIADLFSHQGITIRSTGAADRVESK